MALTKAHNRMIEGSVINVADFGAVGDGVTDDLAAFDAAVNAASSDSFAGDTIFIPSGTYYLSGLWHVNKPVHIQGNGAYLKGGDSTGVVWYGYRTGSDQNKYFLKKTVRDFTVEATTAGGEGFLTSKSLQCVFSNISAEACADRGLVFQAAVACQFDTVGAGSCQGSGIVLTYFTNSDGTTHVPSTANTFVNPRATGNAIGGAGYGIYFGLNPDGDAGNYGNTVIGGNVEANQFTGMRVYGDNNQIRGVWFESNGQDSGSANQYNLQISGDSCLVDGGRNQGAGVLRKIFVDTNIDNPIIQNVYFNGTLQSDIEYDTGVTNWVLENNRYSGSSPAIRPSTYDIRDNVIGTQRKNEPDDTFYWKTITVDVPENTSGVIQYFNLFIMGASGFSRISMEVFDPGSPPTYVRQIVNAYTVTPASNYYFQFVEPDAVSSELESCYIRNANSNTADVPVLQITPAGAVNYKHNVGSSAKTLNVTFSVQP